MYLTDFFSPRLLVFPPHPCTPLHASRVFAFAWFTGGRQSLENRCSILVGPYGGYLVPESCGDASSTQDEEVVEPQQEEEKEKEKEKSAAVTLPYVAQDNLELLTVDLVERCLDSTYKGGDLLGQHPETGEDVGCVLCDWLAGWLWQGFKFACLFSVGRFSVVIMTLRVFCCWIRVLLRHRRGTNTQASHVELTAGLWSGTEEKKVKCNGRGLVATRKSLTAQRR